MKIKLVVMFIIATIAICLITNICYCLNLEETEQFRPSIDVGLAELLGGTIGVVQIVGTAVAVGASIYLGIRYLGSGQYGDLYIECKSNFVYFNKFIIPILIIILL